MKIFSHDITQADQLMCIRFHADMSELRIRSYDLWRGRVGCKVCRNGLPSSVAISNADFGLSFNMSGTPIEAAGTLFWVSQTTPYAMCEGHRIAARILSQDRQCYLQGNIILLFTPETHPSFLTTQQGRKLHTAKKNFGARWCSGVAMEIR